MNHEHLNCVRDDDGTLTCTPTVEVDWSGIDPDVLHVCVALVVLATVGVFLYALWELYGYRVRRWFAPRPKTYAPVSRPENNPVFGYTRGTLVELVHNPRVPGLDPVGATETCGPVRSLVGVVEDKDFEDDEVHYRVRWANGVLTNETPETVRLRIH